MAAPEEFVGDGESLPAPAIITIGKIPNDVIKRASSGGGSDTTLNSPPRVRDTGTINTDYTIKHYYETDMHRYLMGITSPTASSPAIVQLAGKVLLWICDWTAASLGAHPIIPDSVPQQINKWVLLDEHYVPVSVVAVTDSVTPLYRISGTYVYGCLTPNDRTVRDITFPVGAWMIASEFDRAIDETWVQKGFTDGDLKSQQSNSNNNQQTRG